MVAPYTINAISSACFGVEDDNMMKVRLKIRLGICFNRRNYKSEINIVRNTSADATCPSSGVKQWIVRKRRLLGVYDRSPPSEED